MNSTPHVATPNYWELNVTTNETKCAVFIFYIDKPIFNARQHMFINFGRLFPTLGIPVEVEFQLTTIANIARWCDRNRRFFFAVTVQWNESALSLLSIFSLRQ